MALERIEWTCPDCGKRFAIPANATMPKRCPSCQQSATQKVATPTETPPVKRPPQSAKPVISALEPPLPNFDGVESQSKETIAPLIAVPTSHSRGINQRNLPRIYPALRTLSLVSRVLGGMVVALTLYFNVRVSLFLAQDEIRRSFKKSADYIFTIIEVNILILLIGAFWGMLLFALAELILLMIDIEENTRKKNE